MTSGPRIGELLIANHPPHFLRTSQIAVIQCRITHGMPAPLLSFARYRDIATALAARLDAGSGEEVIVASGGVANAITAELLQRSASGAVSVRLLTIDNFARRMVNDAGQDPRVADEPERGVEMPPAAQPIDDPILQSRGVASMLERSYRDVPD